MKIIKTGDWLAGQALQDDFVLQRGDSVPLLLDRLLMVGAYGNVFENSILLHSMLKLLYLSFRSMTPLDVRKRKKLNSLCTAGSVENLM